MKNHNVVSKYKNPDRFIERLKTELDWAETRNKNLRNEAEKLRNEQKEIEAMRNSEKWFTYETAKEIGVDLSRVRFFFIKDIENC